MKVLDKEQTTTQLNGGKTKAQINAEIKLAKKILALKKDLESQIQVTELEYLKNCIDYGKDRFSDLPVNRDVKPANVNKMFKAFKDVNPNNVSTLTVIRSGAWTNGILVDYMVDGHHRRESALELSRLLGKPVPLSIKIIQIDGEGMDTIENVGKILETLNVNVSLWNPKDFTTHNSKLELKFSNDYKTFEVIKKSLSVKLTESDLIPILSLGQTSPNKFKSKQFIIPDIKKSKTIIKIFEEIGLNDPKIGFYDGVPQNNCKRIMVKALIVLDSNVLRSGVTKMRKFIAVEKLAYDETRFRQQLDIIFRA